MSSCFKGFFVLMKSPYLNEQGDKVYVYELDHYRFGLCTLDDAKEPF